MKKIIILGLSVCLLLAACGQHTSKPSETGSTPDTSETSASEKETETEGPKKELHPEMHLQSTVYNGFIETEDAIYYHDWMRERIRFSVDKGSHFYPLCSKANCDHSDRTCMAYGEGLTYYNGDLYTIRIDTDSGFFRVVRISPDGTDQIEIQKIAIPESGGSFRFYFHNGKAFVLMRPNQILPLEKQIYRIVVTDLATGKVTEPLQELLQYGVEVQLRHFYQNTMVINLCGTNFKTGMDDYRVVCVDLKTWDRQEYLNGEFAGIGYMDEEKMYFYFATKQTELSPGGDLKEGFYEVDRKTGECVCRLETDMFINALYDEDYIYANGPYKDKSRQHHTLYLYDRDYNLVDQTDLDNYEFLAYVCSDRLFFSRTYDGGKIFLYMDKAAVGSGEWPINPVNN